MRIVLSVTPISSEKIIEPGNLHQTDLQKLFALAPSPKPKAVKVVCHIYCQVPILFCLLKGIVIHSPTVIGRES